MTLFPIPLDVMARKSGPPSWGLFIAQVMLALLLFLEFAMRHLGGPLLRAMTKKGDANSNFWLVK